MATGFPGTSPLRATTVAIPSLEEIETLQLAKFLQNMIFLQAFCKPMPVLQESCKTMQILQHDKLECQSCKNLARTCNSCKIINQNLARHHSYDNVVNGFINCRERCFSLVFVRFFSRKVRLRSI